MERFSRLQLLRRFPEKPSARVRAGPGPDAETEPEPAIRFLLSCRVTSLVSKPLVLARARRSLGTLAVGFAPFVELRFLLRGSQCSEGSILFVGDPRRKSGLGFCSSRPR
jgi:hypothetical protein